MESPSSGKHAPEKQENIGRQIRGICCAVVLLFSTVVAVENAAPLPVKADHIRLYIQLAVLLCSICIILITVKYLKKQVTPQRFLTTTRLSVMDKEVQRACRYIEKNYMDPDLSAQHVCRELVTGESFLEALMERDLGISISDFIAHVRINNATRIVDKQNMVSEEEMAEKTGFSDPEAFRKTFKKITGTAFEAYMDLRGKKPQ